MTRSSSRRRESSGSARGGLPKRLKRIEDVDIDLEELEEDRRRNERERRRMLDEYAKWLEDRGVVDNGRGPKKGARRRSKAAR